MRLTARQGCVAIGGLLSAGVGHSCASLRGRQLSGHSAWSARTFGEGTVVTCWHCVQRPAGPDEACGVAVRRSGIAAGYEFCSIDDLGRDDNDADLALGRIGWTPGRALTLATDP
jgi:hypothetical protein